MKRENNFRFKIYKIILTGNVLFASLLILTSCEKVVYIDLNTSNPLPVVEANITNHAGPYTVKLSRSVNYYDSNTFPAITDATVTISDNAGNTETLQQTKPGIYTTLTTQGIPGRTYNLKVIYNGKEYDATSTMPNPVPIDSVIFVYYTNSGGFGGGGENKSGYRITTYFKDPQELGNYYLVKLSSNDTAAINNTNYKLLSDKLTNGEEMAQSSRLKGAMPGDSVIVILESIDLATYNFFSTLGSVTGDGSGFLSAPPSNPVNNISNGGLGYFSAYSYVKKNCIIP